MSRRSALGLFGIVPAAAAGAWALGSGRPAAATSRTDTAPSSDVVVGDVQKAMEDVAATAGAVSAIGEVYVDGKRVGHGSAGSRLLGGRGGTVPSDSRYRLASQTKFMVATAALQLVDEGRLDVDAPLARVLPEAGRDDLVEHADEITVRKLIRHTSGIPDFVPSGWFDPFDFDTYHPPLELVAAARTVPRETEVGAFHYSTTNYVLLGLIMERAARQPLPDVLAERIFSPLGMTRTYLPTRPPHGIKGCHAHGYFPDENGRPRDVDRLNASTYGVQGAISTARDVSAFQRAFDLGTLLPAELQEILMSLGRSDDTGTDTGTPAPQNGQPPLGVCGGTPALRPAAGGSPGLAATTFSSKDGRLQFAISVTLSVDNMQFPGTAVDQAAATVFCPAG
ncbi:serine hydrolase domain-containing protein [Streptomyces sp. RFCAC02]|uniref:serine hydrolase domain-containing protein n=1 Tax=Streptomyces sp. RFCAC02 TaxID=2499143 RepID=UPI00143DF567|nr:serine hydrolase domain-containing protein [Streptomyces sp. RFCAC02]